MKCFGFYSVTPYHDMWWWNSRTMVCMYHFLCVFVCLCLVCFQLHQDVYVFTYVERHDSMIFSAPTNLNMSRNALGKQNMWISWASATILYTPVHQLCADMHRYDLYLILCIYINILKIYIYIFVSPPIYSWLWIHGLYIGAATAPWANFV